EWYAVGATQPSGWGWGALHRTLGGWLGNAVEPGRVDEFLACHAGPVAAEAFRQVSTSARRAREDALAAETDRILVRDHLRGHGGRRAPRPSHWRPSAYRQRRSW